LPYRAPRLLALTLALTVASAPLCAIAQPAAAQVEIVAGDKAARGKDYAAALTHYQTAHLASPSARAQLGVADALYALGRAGESFEAYNDVQVTYGPKLGPVEKALVARRLKELATKTGWLSIRVGEAGAEVDVDGKSLGMSPVPVLVRVAAGGHDVKVTKSGFASFAARAEVGVDGTAIVEARLAAAATQAHVAVHASGSEPLRVILDGVDVGVTPWEGDLAPGTHTIAGRSSSAQAEAQTVELAVGSRAVVDLVSSATAAHLQIRTNDGKGSIYVDGVVKGEGAFAGDVAPGPHSVVVSRDGFQRFEKSMALAERQTWAETVTLEPAVAAGATTSEGERALEGIYGGFGFLETNGLGGMGTELATNCPSLGATTCSTPSPLGGGAFGYVGWTWNPVGFELFVTGTGDDASQKAIYNGTTASGGALVPASAPARTETFSFVRFGGMAAIRARAMFQTRRIRGTVAGGVGLSFHEMVMKRSATDSAGESNQYVPPSGVGYLSPAISAEAAIQIRFTQTLGLSIGLQLMVDNASIAGSNSVPAGPPLPLGASGSTIPTPEYHLATGPQVTLGPFVGLAFGP
jgi:hypothetical protein